MPRPPVQKITLTDLRTLFNTEVLPKIGTNELLEMVLVSRLASPLAGQPPGTLSQMVEYWATEDGRLVKRATVHRYLRPDGGLGASGLPDPKQVFHEGVLYRPDN
jgi:hypothetical protein